MINLLIDVIETGTLDFIGKYIEWLAKIFGSVGVGVIFFTLTLKCITFPLDFYSRASMKKNELKMKEMEPHLLKLQKQYAHDKNLYNQKMMALYKKNGYSMFGACLPTIISLVFFIWVLGSFNSFSEVKKKENFNQLAEAYNKAVEQNLTDDEIHERLYSVYGEYTEKFLWVKNIWVADTFWTKEFQQVSKDGNDYSTLIKYVPNSNNGLMLFPLISMGVTVLSQFIMSKNQKKTLELQGQNPKMMKYMMYIMPIMIGFFALQYSTAFTVYMISNSTMTILTTLLINKVVTLKFAKEKARIESLKSVSNRDFSKRI